MTATAVVLLVISALTHAGWNLIGKRFHSTAASFLAASAIGVLILLPFPLLFGGVVRGLPPITWILVIIAGLCQAAYYISLAAAYRRGDMSLVYPLARSTPAILVAVFAVAIGRANDISPQAFTGIALIVIGGYLLPMRHFRDFSLRKYLNVALGFALCAAVGTAGYSLVDDGALREAWTTLGEGIPSWQVSAVYAFFEGIASAIWMAVYVLFVPRERRSFAQLIGSGGASMRGAALMGVGIYVTYTIVLASMAFVRDVSYVVAFRQLSIPLGVVMGAIILREKLHAPRIVGTLLMFAGLLLVGTG
jgi:drug/metabolite transporter (DMT)-like permease